jgi:4-hydroxythreonine-4-phosphate dehydrogenase
MAKDTKHLPVIGITMGDPAGIGPEIIIKALSSKDIFDICSPVVFGDEKILKRESKDPEISFEALTRDSLKNASFKTGTISMIPVSSLNPDQTDYGKPNKSTGNAMAKYIREAVSSALADEIEAVVTAPINKKSLQDAGQNFPGHTEMLASLTKTKDVAMMLAGSTLRVVLVTIHCALKDVRSKLDQDKILKIITITNHNLKNYFGVKKPRIAVASLNPHAGESGLFGKEETDIILPAISKAKENGINAAGPFPSDTLFYSASKGAFDAVVCMYHDQGLIPLKLLHFEDGVNITLGLPIIRTSVDHGTAYDIAGKGVANPLSLISAIKTATAMASNRKQNPK